jgi:hypothetical protein
MFELPENDQLDVYTVQKDTPSREYQRPSPLMEGPNIHPWKNNMSNRPSTWIAKEIKEKYTFSLFFFYAKYTFSYLVRTKVMIHLTHETLAKSHNLTPYQVHLVIIIYKTTQDEIKLITHLIISFSFWIKITSTSCTS